MFSFPSSNNHFQSSSESGDSLSDSFLDTEVSLESHTLNSMAGDFALGLGSPPFISALDEDVPDFERHNDSNTREIFLASQPAGEPGHLLKTNFCHPELPSPSQFRYKSSQQAGDGTYISRLNHYLPQLITENLNSTVYTSVLETSSIGCAPEPNSATSTTISSCEESPHYRTEHLPGSSKDPQNDHPPRPRKTRREKPRIELAPDQPPTTQGKPRARVYVACVQWYVFYSLQSGDRLCILVFERLHVVELEKSAAMAQNQHATTAVVERLAMEGHVLMIQHPSVVDLTRCQAPVSAMQGTRVKG